MLLFPPNTSKLLNDIQVRCSFSYKTHYGMAQQIAIALSYIPVEHHVAYLNTLKYNGFCDTCDFNGVFEHLKHILTNSSNMLLPQHLNTFFTENRI
jgi:hypothetical protein